MILTEATEHVGDPCEYCHEANRKDVLCNKRVCDVLACRQPKDPKYTSDEWTWCLGHGKLYKKQKTESRRVNNGIRKATLANRIYKTRA